MLTRPTAARCAALPALISEVESTIHDLMIGGAIVRVGFEGKETQYTPAKLPDLTVYMNALQAELALCGGCYRNQRRVIGVVPMI